MVMHARKTQRIGDGYFEKHQTHPYQVVSGDSAHLKNSKYSSSKGVSQQYAAVADRCGGKGGDCKELDGGGNFRSGVGGTPRMRGDTSPGGGGGGGGVGPNGNNSGGASSVPGGAAALLRHHSDRSPDCENYKNAAAFQQQKVRAVENKERDTRDYKRGDKYSDCVRSPKDKRSREARDSEHRTNHDRNSSEKVILHTIKLSSQNASRDTTQRKPLLTACQDKRDDRDRERDRDRDNRDRDRDRDRDRGERDRSERDRDRSERGGGGSERERERVLRVGDWSEHLSSSGKKYYYNCKTEVSQWEKPREWLEKEQQRTQRNAAAAQAAAANYNAVTQRQMAHDKHSNSRGGVTSVVPSSVTKVGGAAVVAGSRGGGAVVNSGGGGMDKRGDHQHHQHHHMNASAANYWPGQHHHSHQMNAHDGGVVMTGMPVVGLDANPNQQAQDMEICSGDSTPTESEASYVAPPSSAVGVVTGVASLAAHAPVVAAAGGVASSLAPVVGSVTSSAHAPLVGGVAVGVVVGDGVGGANAPGPPVAPVLQPVPPLQPLKVDVVSAAANAAAAPDPSGPPTPTHSESHDCQDVRKCSPPSSLSSLQSLTVAAGAGLGAVGVGALAGTGLVLGLGGGVLALTPSLANHYRDDLVNHVRNWPADVCEKQAQKLNEEAHTLGSLQCTRVSADLKSARSVVRLTEIQATLQEQRVLFLRQQIKTLEELKSQNSFMGDDC